MLAKKKFKTKAVIFDMDGVITDTMPYHFRAWKEIYRREGILVTKREIYSREGQPGIQTVREITKEKGRPFGEDKIRQVLKAKEELFKRIVKRRFISGSRAYLHFLKQEGFNLALVTGTARHEVERILPKSILRLFCATVSGDEVKRGKPHPDPYLLSLKRLKIKAKDAIVIENAPCGIHSAKHAGLRCFAIETSLPRGYLKDADCIFSSFKELRQRVSLEASL